MFGRNNFRQTENETYLIKNDTYFAFDLYEGTPVSLDADMYHEKIKLLT